MGMAKVIKYIAGYQGNAVLASITAAKVFYKLYITNCTSLTRWNALVVKVGVSYQWQIVFNTTFKYVFAIMHSLVTTPFSHDLLKIVL